MPRNRAPLSSRRLLAALACAVSFAPLPSRAALDLAPEQLIGVEFPMAQRGPASRDELRAKLLADLRGKSGWPGDYEVLQRHKAVAIVYEPGNSSIDQARFDEGSASYWGGAWASASEAVARNRALNRCEYGGSRCVLFLVNHRMVLPESLVKAHLDAWPAFDARLRARLRAATKFVLLERVESRLPIGAAASVAWPQPVLIEASPAGRLRESATCGAWPLLLMAQVPTPEVPQWQQRLLQAADRGWLAVPDSAPGAPAVGRRVRFLHEMVIDPSRPMDAQARLPTPLRLAPQLRVLRRLWLEGEATLDDAGQVIRIAHEAAPVAVETHDGLYAGVWMTMADPSACSPALP